MVSTKNATALFLIGALPCLTSAILNATENDSVLVLSNDRFYASLNKSLGYIDALFLDGQNLLGVKEYNPETPGANAAGQNGVFNTDCYCIPSGVYTPGGIDPYFKLLKGNDTTGTPYGGMVMGEVYPPYVTTSRNEKTSLTIL
jgi:rhamnogalacturonan endolyase